MKGLIRGAAGLAIMLTVSACTTDDTIDLMGPPTGIRVNPQTAFILAGDSVAILARLTNDLDQSIPTEFVVSGTGPAITVAYDDRYRPDYTSGTLVAPLIKPQQRYFAKGVANGTSTFTLTSNGLSTTVTIVVQPKTLGDAADLTEGLVAGDLVTLTAPAGTKFTPESAVTLTRGSISITLRSADSTTIKFLLGPGAGGFATVTNVFLDYAPTLGLRTLLTANEIATTPQVTVAPTTVSNAAPAIGAPITVALGGGLRFLSSSHLSIGGREAGIQSVSADSSTATVVPMLGSSGNITYSSVALSFLNTVPFDVPGDKSVTVGATYGGPTDANANAPGTASTVTLTGSRSSIISDNGAFVTSCSAIFGAGATCRYYKVAVTAAGFSGDLRWEAPSNIDLGAYILNAAGTGCVSLIADDFGPQSGAVGEQGIQRTCGGGALAALTASTVTIAIVDFSATKPTWFQFRFSQP